MVKNVGARIKEYLNSIEVSDRRLDERENLLELFNFLAINISWTRQYAMINKASHTKMIELAAIDARFSYYINTLKPLPG